MFNRRVLFLSVFPVLYSCYQVVHLIDLPLGMQMLRMLIRS